MRPHLIASGLVICVPLAIISYFLLTYTWTERTRTSLYEYRFDPIFGIVVGLGSIIGFAMIVAGIALEPRPPQARH